ERAQTRRGSPVGEAHTRKLIRSKPEPEVDAVHDRAAVHPCVAALRPTIGRQSTKEGLAKLSYELHAARCRIRRHAKHAKSARNELERRLHLRAIGRNTEEFRRRHDAANRLPNIAVCFGEDRSAAIYELSRWVVAHKPSRKLGRNEVSCRWSV